MVTEHVDMLYWVNLIISTDRRLDGYPLMSSPTPTAVLVGLYLLFVMIGPRIMKHRQPVNVKIPMMIYNIFLVILSYYMFHEVSSCTLMLFGCEAASFLQLLFGMLDANFTFLCDPIDYSNNPKALRVSWMV